MNEIGTRTAPTVIGIAPVQKPIAVRVKPKPSARGPKPLTGPSVHAGRNEPCPCGSGRKYKNCHRRLIGS